MIASPSSPLKPSLSNDAILLPHFAVGLLSAVDEAWGSLSSLAKCSSHRDMCAIAGARMAKELHKKGATTGADAFESFKSLYDRFTPSPDTLFEIPVPASVGSHNHSSSLSQERSSEKNLTCENFNTKFEFILKKVQWSPANTLASGRSSSSPGATTVASKRPLNESAASGVSSGAAPYAKKIKSS